MPATSNLKEVFAKVNKSVLSASMVDKTMRAIAFAALDDLDKRIFADKKNADGQDIGQYKSDYYVYYKRNYRGPKNPLKKGSKKSRKKPAAISANERKVNLTLSSNTKNSFTVLLDANKWGLGFLDKPDAKQKTPFNKATWNNERYGGRVFAMSKKELEKAVQVGEMELKKFLNQ